MWIISKKQKIEKNNKRKCLFCFKKKFKKFKESVCLFHDEKCICDIYDCCGIKKYNYNISNMPYIN